MWRYTTPASRSPAPYAIIVTDDPDSDEAFKTLEALFCATGGDGAAIVDACWYVPEVATGASYRLQFGASARGSIWYAGRVANIAATEAMRRNLASDILPVANQATINNYFSPRPVNTDVESSEQAGLIQQATSAIYTAFSQESTGDTEELVLMLRHAEMARYFAPERYFIDTEATPCTRVVQGVFFGGVRHHQERDQSGAAGLAVAASTLVTRVSLKQP